MYPLAEINAEKVRNMNIQFKNIHVNKSILEIDFSADKNYYNLSFWLSIFNILKTNLLKNK